MTDIRSDIIFDAVLNGRALRFHSTWGLFSPKHIDEGSIMLLQSLPLGSYERILDLGCGYGALGLPLAAMDPKGIVHMVDKDFVAVEYAKKNAAVNKISNIEIYLSNGFSHVPDMQFDLIVSNIPAKVGKEFYEIIIDDAHVHLKPGGSFSIVFVSHLKEYFKRALNEVFGNYQLAAHNKTYSVLHAIRS